MECAVIVGSVVRTGDSDGSGDLFDGQRAVNKRDVVVRRHIVIRGILDHHTVRRDGNRIGVGGYTLTCQRDRRDVLTIGQATAGDGIVRTCRIGSRSVGDGGTRVLVARVVRRQLERTCRDGQRTFGLSLRGVHCTVGHFIAERIINRRLRHVRDGSRRGGRDRHHVVRGKRDRSCCGSSGNRHGLAEGILARSVGHSVLILRMGVAVVGPAAI